jgi:hypothetical protein
MVIEPFGLAGCAFVDEAQSFGDGLAALILSGTGNHDPIQIELEKSIVDNRSASISDNSLALSIGS